MLENFMLKVFDVHKTNTKSINVSNFVSWTFIYTMMLPVSVFLISKYLIERSNKR
jgi:ABC-type glycerol-3-phosphate transport system permease component